MRCTSFSATPLLSATVGSVWQPESAMLLANSSFICLLQQHRFSHPVWNILLDIYIWSCNNLRGFNVMCAKIYLVCDPPPFCMILLGQYGGQKCIFCCASVSLGAPCRFYLRLCRRGRAPCWDATLRCFRRLANLNAALQQLSREFAAR